MTIYLRVWRQQSVQSEGQLVDYTVKDVSPDMSFLEMFDVLNQQLIKKGEEPIVFDHDCREGICGTCSMTIDGVPHGPEKGVATCQLHMRSYSDGDSIVVEPFRAKSFSIIKDLSVDRSAFDRIVGAGGYVSVNTGSAQDANNLPVPKEDADRAFDFATCIGCGACVAACKNGSAMLFVGAKVAQLSLLPQGQAERTRRAINMVAQMDEEGFGACSTTGACSATCPKEISLEAIARLNREYTRAKLKS
ncbi:MAG: succinate dehydrogenase/fumarate reductase iron-sulfur subunit [Bdellovibrionales bacterium CG10_big_fil_rev_8_21_14_0_10_45_34]|nr:MAG: succinate dehydrogenase/fumarate reductase iron-sulfur subunit [Bdellovibrionales bacterium CG10_big_fil_rev_8_21_14_0_10_45_34]